jgi:hypothetical protein
MNVHTQAVGVCSVVESVETLTSGVDLNMTDVDKTITRLARKRATHLRKEQLSQGVLNRVLQSLGRLVYEEVTC